MFVEFVTHIGIHDSNGLPVGVAVVAVESFAVCAVTLQVVFAPAGGGLLFVFNAAVEGQARTDFKFFVQEPAAEVGNDRPARLDAVDQPTAGETAVLTVRYGEGTAVRDVLVYIILLLNGAAVADFVFHVAHDGKVAEYFAVVEAGVEFQSADDLFVVFKVAGGGQNFVHGGSSPQEMLVPVVEVKMERGHMETKNAEIALVSMVQKITNKITMMDFIQSEPVSDTVKVTTYKIFFISEDNEKISNENSYIADSREPNAQKRIFRMKFQFKDKKYDKDKQYFLVVYDENTGLESFRHPIIMDLAFADDFGFGF